MPLLESALNSIIYGGGEGRGGEPPTETRGIHSLPTTPS